MPLTLSSELPEGFWTHNTGGEHLTKHYADIGEVLAIQAQRGEPTLNPREFEDLMREDGLVVVRTELSDGAAGPIAGYALADRITDSTVLDVKDVYVEPEFRGRGVGSFILARTATLGNWDFPSMHMSIRRLPKSAKLAGVEYALPGDHVTINYILGDDLKDHKVSLRKFKDTIAKKKLSLMLEAHDSEVDECVVYRDGEAVIDLWGDMSINRGDFELAAIRAINDIG